MAYLLYNFIRVCASERLMNLFLGERKSPLLPWLSSFFLYYVASSIAFLFLNVPWITITANVIVLLVISLNYEASKIKKIVGAISTFSVMLFLETTAALLLLGSDLSLVTGAVDVSSITWIFLGLYSYAVILLLTHFKSIKMAHFTTSLTWVVLIVPVGSAVLAWFTIFLPMIIGLASIIILFIINFAGFYFQNELTIAYEDKMKATLDTQEKEYYFAQNELMNDTVEMIKGVRHDMKLHLATLGNYIKDNPEAINYINHLIGDITKSEAYSDTGNIALDSIINFKLKSVKADGIEVELDIFAPAVIDIEATDVVIILGNLLDNALEAVSRVEEKIINVYLSYQKGNLLVRIENTFDGLVNENLTTLKSDDGHGYGLKNLRRSVDKYNGTVDVNHEKGLFSVEVLLYGKD